MAKEMGSNLVLHTRNNVSNLIVIASGIGEKLHRTLACVMSVVNGRYSHHRTGQLPQSHLRSFGPLSSTQLHCSPGCAEVGSSC